MAATIYLFHTVSLFVLGNWLTKREMDEKKKREKKNMLQNYDAICLDTFVIFPKNYEKTSILNEKMHDEKSVMKRNSEMSLLPKNSKL